MTLLSDLMTNDMMRPACEQALTSGDKLIAAGDADMDQYKALSKGSNGKSPNWTEANKHLEMAKASYAAAGRQGLYVMVALSETHQSPQRV